jgi:hypothetical protein
VYVLICTNHAPNPPLVSDPRISNSDLFFP